MFALTRRVMPLIGALALLPACPFCDDVNAFLPQGAIEPAVLDLGPITTGVTCPATLQVTNTGNADLNVVPESAKLIDTDGSFQIQVVPSLIGLGGSEDLVVNYTAGDTIGEREGTGVELQTNDADNDGFLRGTITAFVAAEPVALAKAACVPDGAEADAEATAPCELMNFGAVPIGNALDPIDSRAGVVLTVLVVNDGNADLNVQGAVINGGGDYAFLGAKRGSQLIPLPAVVPAGRSGDCGALSGADNTLVLDVKFAPTVIGPAIASLQILTDGAEGALIEVPLSGQGADTDILTNPEIVVFGDVPEGSTGTQTVLVQNTGTGPASVNESCIDLEDDGVCDGLCTGAAGDATNGGTLACTVFKSDGSRDGKGFVLEATDAAVGGDDERTIEIVWSPDAATPAIPTSAVLILQSNIKNNKVFKVGLSGGNQGVLAISSPTPCGPDLCVQAEGAADDVSTWTGSTTLTLENTGSASLTISEATFATDTPSTIADDWTIGAPGNTTLTPGASTTMTLTYANSPNDFSGVDGFNLIVEHNGVLGQSLASIRVLPPQE
jgi:hypothetical protein